MMYKDYLHPNLKATELLILDWKNCFMYVRHHFWRMDIGKEECIFGILYLLGLFPTLSAFTWSVLVKMLCYFSVKISYCGNKALEKDCSSFMRLSLPKVPVQLSDHIMQTETITRILLPKKWQWTILWCVCFLCKDIHIEPNQMYLISRSYLFLLMHTTGARSHIRSGVINLVAVT